jgi:hypothetical protein
MKLGKSHPKMRRVKLAVQQDEPLSPEWVKEIKRRVRDAGNPIRFVIASALSPRFVSYYNVTTDTFVVNRPEDGTLFKRREIAERVAEILGERHEVVKFTTKNGALKRLSPLHCLLQKKSKRS